MNDIDYANDKAEKLMLRRAAARKTARDLRKYITDLCSKISSSLTVTEISEAPDAAPVDGGRGESQRVLFWSVDLERESLLRFHVRMNIGGLAWCDLSNAIRGKAQFVKRSGGWFRADDHAHANEDAFRDTIVTFLDDAIDRRPYPVAVEPWEYASCRLDTPLAGEGTLAALNSMGHQGWEAVQVLPIDGGALAIFKRRSRLAQD